ncbi:MAG: hypothetical protein K2P84_06635 [Undibacterium sp.]|nr:hypothetical protein [Undibacterium sp.]
MSLLLRLLMWIVLAILVILALRKRLGGTRAGAGSNQTGASDSSGASASSGETMVCCKSCQMYVPASEALIHHGQTYCCQQHATSDIELNEVKTDFRS